MAKCGVCGKFMSANDCARCTKCPLAYHRICVGVTASACAPPNWLCPGCKAKVTRADKATTPVKDTSDVSIDSNYSQSITTVITSTPAITPPAIMPADLNVAHEIRCFREELSALRVELKEYRQEVLDLKVIVSSCNERLESVESRMSALENRFEEGAPSSSNHLEETIADLKLELNERDQELLLNDITISGIPETKEENPTHIVKLVALKLGITVDEQDIVNVERVGMVRRNFTDNVEVGAEPAQPRIIAVRLARRAVRDQLLRAARVRRGLTTADLEMRGRPRKFYLNERLTRINGKLFFNARQAGQRLKFKYVWTKDGRIYARKEDGVKAQRIRSDADVARIFGDASV